MISQLPEFIKLFSIMEEVLSNTGSPEYIFADFEKNYKTKFLFFKLRDTLDRRKSRAISLAMDSYSFKSLKGPVHTISKVGGKTYSLSPNFYADLFKYAEISPKIFYECMDHSLPKSSLIALDVSLEEFLESIYSPQNTSILEDICTNV